MRSHSDRAFTLVELLVVIAIIGIPNRHSTSRRSDGSRSRTARAVY